MERGFYREDGKMLITWTILFFVFALIAIINLVKYVFGSGLTKSEAALMVFSIIVAAVTAGQIWGQP
jgi:hypothetical protein